MMCTKVHIFCIFIIINVHSSDSDDAEDDFADLHDDPLFEMNNTKNIEQKYPENFQHKILNNDLFSKDKTCNVEADIGDKRRY